MAVKLRLTRIGRRHRPFFRLNAVDSRTPRDGKVLEPLGHYDPIEKDAAKQYVLKKDRIEFWLAQGAVPSDTVAELLTRIGVETKYAKVKSLRTNRSRELARKAKKPYTRAEKIAAGVIKVEKKRGT
ncbi:MAG: 30S ribosomal protein S16 [Planctomycetes bacterium GWF2_50_10]|nr:MAG: 30S ribosomal protein S16 [Planctomycetes bacterium GWF2_50_10]